MNNKNQNGVNRVFGVASTIFGLIGIATGMFLSSYFALVSGIVSLACALRARRLGSFTPAARFGLFLSIVCFALFIAMLIWVVVLTSRYA